MIAALDNATAGRCNEGFLRTDANLVVIFVSNENDIDAVPVAHCLDELSRFKPLSLTRIGAIVGVVDGMASDCRVGHGALCGSLCENMPPSGSGQVCRPSMEGDCGAGEFCNVAAAREPYCENEALRYWHPRACGWCDFYATEDCCSALAGERYTEFARLFEQRLSRVDPSYVASGCRGSVDGRAACLVESICQESFRDSLERIARALVVRTQLVGSVAIPATVAESETGVFVNGVWRAADRDYVVSGTTVTFTPALVSGDLVEVFCR